MAFREWNDILDQNMWKSKYVYIFILMIKICKFLVSIRILYEKHSNPILWILCCILQLCCIYAFFSIIKKNLLNKNPIIFVFFFLNTINYKSVQDIQEKKHIRFWQIISWKQSKSDEQVFSKSIFIYGLAVGSEKILINSIQNWPHKYFYL